jgi:hypothetical protein
VTEDHSGSSCSWRRKVRQFAIPAAGLSLITGMFVLGLSTGTSQKSVENKWATKLLEFPPFVASPAVPAEAVRLAPTAPVIGVTIGNRHRAYVIEAMKKRVAHVINDRIGEAPVAVAYCDRLNCARAFTPQNGGKTTELTLGGWYDSADAHDMLVRVGTHRYYLTTGRPMDGLASPFPYRTVTTELTTWQEWRAAHPDTDVYLGGGRVLNHPVVAN